MSHRRILADFILLFIILDFTISEVKNMFNKTYNYISDL